VELADEIQDLYFDLMVLSVGMTPVAVPPALEQELGLLPSAEGFLLPKGCDGVYVVGSATGPMDIPGSITHALAAVPAIAAELEGGK
jgi:heterodisulfide reductase subunit A-like polyferredoxin